MTTYNINQQAADMTDAEVRAYLNNARRYIDDETMISAVVEKFNCSDVFIDEDDCYIFIAKPMTGHYLNMDEAREFASFLQNQ